MKKGKLNEAIGAIDDDLLRSADDIVPASDGKTARRIAFWRAAAIAAVFLFVVSATAFAFIITQNGVPSVSGENNSGAESAVQSGEENIAGYEKKATLYLGPVEYAAGRVIESDLEEYLGEELEASAADQIVISPDIYCNIVNNVSPDVAVAGLNSAGDYVWYVNTHYAPQTLGSYLSALGLSAAGISAKNYGMDVTGMLNMELPGSYSAKLVEKPGDTGPVLFVYDVTIGAVEGQMIFTRYNYILTDFMGDKRVFLREGGVIDLMPDKVESDESAEETSGYFGPDHQTAEFLEALEKSGIRRNGMDYCVNTTPEWMYERTGAQRFSLSVVDGTYIWLDGEIYDLGGPSICKLFTAMYPCDYDGDGATDILYHFTYGSGFDGWRCGVFNTKTKTDTLLDIPFFCPGSKSQLIEVTTLSDGGLHTKYCIASKASWISGSPMYCDGYVYGTLVSDTSSPGGVSFRWCEKYQIVNLNKYWEKLKRDFNKDYFTFDEIYACCVSLFAERSLINPGVTVKGSYDENHYIIYADEANLERNLLSVLSYTMVFSFEKYSYQHTEFYSGRFGIASNRCYYGEAIGDIEESARSVSAVRAVPHITVDLMDHKIYGEDNKTDYTRYYAEKYPVSKYVKDDPGNDDPKSDPSAQ